VEHALPYYITMVSKKNSNDLVLIYNHDFLKNYSNKHYIKLDVLFQSFHGNYLEFFEGFETNVEHSA
jgi:hypothetical protein